MQRASMAGCTSPQSTHNRLESTKTIIRALSWHQLEYLNYLLKRSSASSVSRAGLRPSTHGEWKAISIPLANQPYGYGQCMKRQKLILKRRVEPRV